MKKECPNDEAKHAILSSGDAEFASLCAQLLSCGNSVRFRANGSSMRPFILNGDLITVIPVSAAQLRLGDVALYRRKTGDLLAHRVIARAYRDKSIVILVRGDASMGRMERVSADHILGRVMFAMRGKTAFGVSHAFPRYRALLRLKGRQLLHRIAPATSRHAISGMRKLGRIFTESD